MKVLVVGANGHTGRLIIDYMATHTEDHPYAMIRNENQEKELMKLGAAEVIVTDLEQEIVHEITKGMDAIIFAAGSGSHTGPDKTIEVDQEGAKKLIDSAKENQISHFVMLSAIGADEPQGPIEHYLTAKKEADDYLINSGLTYTIVRPGGLTHDSSTGKVAIAEKLDIVDERQIPRGDVAHILVASLHIKNTQNKIFEVTSGDKDIEKALEII
ncbi:SDR family oxidoreductase [Bacillus sp. SD088]|uniref:SDR family oxidoreductase n=1 Tax=Bacillus sp. SD088 TaxID=2782012 RepID=UPI001A958044|nr:SDR family oxidoreductase [Bacillus sp. SD088]MBO0995542.1 SDR family oxidoreductase [Bacillus sp. SD088]